MSENVTASIPEKNENGTFNVEVSAFIKASAKTIYNIITDRQGFADFMSCDIKEDIKPGGPMEFIFDVAYTDENGVTHDPPAISSGKVIKMIPNELFSFTWGDGRGFNKDFPPGSTLVEFKIKPEQENGVDGCRVTICHHDLPSEYLANDHSDGWSYHLGDCVNKFAYNRSIIF